MKNIIKFFKNTLSNNLGKMSSGVVAGLSAGAFVAVIGYSVYNAYNNSPAYNPAKRAIYTGEGLSSGGNSLDGSSLNSQKPGTLSGSDYTGSRFIGSRGRKTSSDIDKEQAKFDAARAYLDSQKSGAIQAEDADGAYQPFNSTYEQGADGMEFDAAGPNSAYGEDRFNEAQAAVAGAVAGVAGKGETNGKDGNKRQNGKGENDKAAGATAQVRQATQINKLASSSGSSTFGGVGGTGSNGVQGGVSTSFATGSTTGGSDNNTRALPQTNMQAGAGNSQAFQHGRMGGMGGINAGFSGSEYKGSNSKGSGAASDLQVAVAYSGKALATLQESGSKSLAEAAFDGSNPEDVVTTIPEVATIDKIANALLDANNMGDLPEALRTSINGLEKDLKETAERAAELAALQKKLKWIKIGMMAGAVLFGIGIFFLRKIPGPWGIVAAIIASVAAAAFITGMGLWMKNILDQMADLKFQALTQGFDWFDKYKSVFMTGASALATAMYLGWSNRIDKIIQKFKDWFIKPKASSLPKGGREAVEEISKGISEDIFNKSGGGLH